MQTASRRNDAHTIVILQLASLEIERLISLSVEHSRVSNGIRGLFIPRELFLELYSTNQEFIRSKLALPIAQHQHSSKQADKADGESSSRPSAITKPPIPLFSFIIKKCLDTI